MGIVTGIVALVFLLIVGIVAYSLFSDAFDSINEDLEEKINKQTSQDDPAPDRDGNLAKDTGTRVCDLEIIFVGSVTGESFSDDVKMWQGELSAFTIFGEVHQIHDPDIVEYRWVCLDPPTPASNNLVKNNIFDKMSFDSSIKIDELVENNLLRTTKTTSLFVFFEGTSLNTGKSLVAREGPDKPLILDFKDFYVIPDDTPYPIEYRVKAHLFDVTEDDYVIQYHNDKFRWNDKNPGHVFEYYLCRPGMTWGGGACVPNT